MNPSPAIGNTKNGNNAGDAVLWAAENVDATDPFVQAPGYTQNYNRYSYAWNNPLKYTDPSGYYIDDNRDYTPAHIYLDSGGSSGSWLSGNQMYMTGGFGPGSGRHWSDQHRSVWGNFMLGSNSSFTGIYGRGLYMFYAGYYTGENIRYVWNPVAGDEVSREWGKGFVNVYYSGDWVQASPFTGPTFGGSVPMYSNALTDGPGAANGGGGLFSGTYNSAIGRTMVPDFLAVGVGFNGVFGVGGGTSIDFRWVTRGPEASWKPMITVTQSIGGGFSVDATLNIETANYFGNVNNITRSMWQTSSPDGDYPTIFMAGGVAAGGKIGITGYVTPNVGGSFIFGRELNIGVGLPAGPLPINGAVGASNTWILYDFYK
jgi:hypothetical protein